MVSYYADTKKAALDLFNWVKDDKRGRWSDFIRTMQLRYGFSSKKMERMLNDSYPDFFILDDKLMDKLQ